ncbi:mCG1030238 [Mus musculus]|nr:mCG1030238 [Mus musculus]
MHSKQVLLLLSHVPKLLFCIVRDILKDYFRGRGYWQKL